MATSDEMKTAILQGTTKKTDPGNGIRNEIHHGNYYKGRPQKILKGRGQYKRIFTGPDINYEVWFKEL
jgi:hypothetical protein